MSEFLSLCEMANKLSMVGVAIIEVNEEKLGLTISDCSDNYCAMIGIGRNELIGRDPRAYKEYEDGARIDDFLTHLQMGQVNEVEYTEVYSCGLKDKKKTVAIPFRYGNRLYYVSMCMSLLLTHI